jgi:hypothetical protein
MPGSARTPALGLSALLFAACGDDEAAHTDTHDAASTTATTSTSADTQTATTTSADTETTGAPVEPPPSGPLRAGAAVGYLDGPIGVSMAGYGLRTITQNTPWNHVLNASRGFHGLPTIKALVLDVDGERLVLLKIPTMSGEASLTEGTADKLLALHGLDLRGRLLTAATHSHHTQARYWRLPDALGLVGADTRDEEVIDRMTTAFAEVVARAVDDLGPAEWGWTFQDDWDLPDHVYRDRRGENDPTYGKDPRLTLLAVRRPAGAPLAALINFGMHGTLFGADNELLTEDAAGGLEMIFEERFFAAHGAPILGMFVQSGGGDAAPAGDRHSHRAPQRAELIGHDAAPAILALYDALEWRQDAALAVRSRRVDLTYAGIGYDQLPEFLSPGGTPYTWGGWQCKGEDLEGKPKSCTDVGGLLESLGEAVPHGEVHQAYLSAALIDDLALVTLPGEPTYSVIKHLRESLAERDLQPLALGYSQDHLLYLSHPDDWYQGGYETEMSLWGPLAAKHLIARQMQIVDDLRAIRDLPVFDEQSPNLSLPAPFSPRARERSLDPGALLLAPPDQLTRLEVARFTWGGGDPTIDTPHVRLQRDPGDGTFVDVPAPSGWPGAVYDNRRYAMITSYAPIPAPNGEILPERAHHWTVEWELPIDQPSANYRLVARGHSWDGAQLVPYEVTTPPFWVRQSPTAALTLAKLGDELELRLTLGALAPEQTVSWLSRGYRLHDPEIGPDGPFQLRAPLSVALVLDGEKDDQHHQALFDPRRGVHVLDLGVIAPGQEVIGARAHLAADIIPDELDAPLP